MRHGSLFSGIGGFDLAADWMGWENIFHCEWNPFCQRVLKHYWPNAISYEDICTTDFTVHRGNISIITGGFPCQPFSTAGKRKGTGDSRYLWPEMLRAIREIRPSWIVGENVYGLVNWDGGLVFDTVCADLENEGFKVIPIVLPAAGVNSPHRRDRIWFVAYSTSNGKASDRCSDTIERGRKAALFQKDERRESEAVQPFGLCGLVRDAADTESERLTPQQTGSAEFLSSQGQRLYGRGSIGQIPGWENFPTVSPVCNGDDGLSDRLDAITFSKWRNESIKGGGNAIVPQVAYQIFKTIELCEKQQLT